MDIKLTIKLLSLAIIGLWPAYSAAQTDSISNLYHYYIGREEPPIYDLSRPPKLVEIEPHLAIGLNSAMTNYSSAIPGLQDLMSSSGVVLRAGVDVRFSISNAWSVGTGLEADINNSRYAMSIVDNRTGSINSLYVKNHFYKIIIPVYLSCRLSLGRRMKAEGSLGFYLANGLGGNTDVSGYTSGQNPIGQPVITHVTYNTKYYNAPQPLIHGVRDFDWGPRISAGFIYREHYYSGVILEVGARNLAINHDVLDISYHNITVAYQIGYCF